MNEELMYKLVNLLECCVDILKLVIEDEKEKAKAEAFEEMDKTIEDFFKEWIHED